MSNQEKDYWNKLDIHYLNEQLSFARGEKKLQKYLFGLLVLFLAAGLLGFFSNGVLSQKKITGSEFDIEYQQFMREDTPTEMNIILKNSRDSTVVSINKNYLQQVRIEQVIPEPLSVKSVQDQLLYTLDTAEKSFAIFYVKPERSGFITLEIGINEDVKKLTQTIYF